MNGSIRTVGPVTAGSLLWHQEGTLWVTVVLRTAYVLAPGTSVAAQPGTVDDLAPRLARAEILHLGPATGPDARLAVARGGQVVLDKRPGPFGALTYDSAERQAPLRGALPPARDGNGALAIPAGFDFAFYQWAPADQRLDRITGGDQILLANFYSGHSDIVVTIPPRAPFARATLGDQEAPVPLHCRRALVDTNRRVYSLVWYGELELPGLEAVPHLRIEARSPEDPVITSLPAAAVPVISVPAVEQAGPERTRRPNPLAGTVAPIESTRAAMPFSGSSAPPRSRPLAHAAGAATPWGGQALRRAPRPGDAYADTIDADDATAPAPEPPVALAAPASPPVAVSSAPPPAEEARWAPSASELVPSAASASSRPTPAPAAAPAATPAAPSTLKKGLYNKFAARK